MAKLRCCRACLIEMERIALADGSVVLLCTACDVIGIESDVLLGGPVWAAGMTAIQTPARRRAKASEVWRGARGT